MRKDLVEQGRDKEKAFHVQRLAWDCVQGQRPSLAQGQSIQAGISRVGVLEGSSPCSDLGNGHGTVVAPSSEPGGLLGSGFQGQAPCNVQTVADAGTSWVLQTHLMSFNNH